MLETHFNILSKSHKASDYDKLLGKKNKDKFNLSSYQSSFSEYRDRGIPRTLSNIYEATKNDTPKTQLEPPPLVSLLVINISNPLPPCH